MRRGLQYLVLCVSPYFFGVCPPFQVLLVRMLLLFFLVDIPEVYLFSDPLPLRGDLIFLFYCHLGAGCVGLPLKSSIIILFGCHVVGKGGSLEWDDFLEFPDGGILQEIIEIRILCIHGVSYVNFQAKGLKAKWLDIR